jgi:hypothetical protein
MTSRDRRTLLFDIFFLSLLFLLGAELLKLLT